jgi:branched-chain amino acid transport system permease protein
MSSLLQCVIDAVLLGGLYRLMAVGLSLGFGVTRIINFAHGEFIMLGGYGAYFAATLAGIDPLLSLPVVILAVALSSIVVFELCLRRVLRAPAINQILLLFGVGLVLQNIAAILWTGDSRSVTTGYSLRAEEWGDLYIPDGRILAFGVAAILVGVLLWWLRRTEQGRAIRAVAQNRDAALLMGINVTGVYRLAFAMNAALGAATGAMASFLLTVTPFMGFHMLIKSFAIVVLGGLGSVAGTLAGAFLLAAAETVVAYYVPDGIGWAEGVAFLVLLGVLVLRPRGILGAAVEVA